MRIESIKAIPANIAAFLAAPRYGVIATHEPDGGLWQVVVWYVVTDDGIVMNARDGRRWLTNLRRDSRLSLVVADGEDYAILRGHAVATDDPVRGLAEGLALAKRYRSDDTYEGQRRVSILFRPEHLALHGQLAESGDA